MINLYSPAKFTIEEVAQSLNVSKSLLRLWEEEFDLPKRENGTMSGLEVAELRLIHNLIQDKGFTLEDAKVEFDIQRSQLEIRFKTVESLHRIKSGLLDLRDKI